MPSPVPPVPLKDHCSVIHGNVLYVYSPDALQSLPLREDATWSQEPMGISVKGGRCVLGGTDGDHSRAALYIVGGATNSSSTQYAGLQRYSLLDKKWDNIALVTPVTQNRQRHGAAFLNASSSILVYAGSQDGDNNPSTQTFLLETWPPYNVRSFNSLAPPVVDPVMLMWDDNHAAMVGGSSTNNQVFTFGPDDGWADTGIVLTQPPPNPSISQSTILSLADGSKILITFDMSQSPNKVTRTVVLGQGGARAEYGATVGDGGKPPSQRRDVLLSTFPKYNDTLAPKTIREGASLAQDQAGLSIISGGDGQGTLSMFKALDNRWLDPREILGDPPQTPIHGSPTSIVPLPTGSTSIPSPPPPPSSSHPLTILGAVLGTICGIAAILIIALLVLRWRKQKRTQESRNSDFGDDKRGKDGRLSFEDQSMQPIRPAAQPMGHSLPPSAEDLTTIGGKGSHTRESSSANSVLRLDTQRSSNISFGPGMFSKTRSPLSISRPTPLEDPAAIQERPIPGGARAAPNAAGGLTGSSHRKDDSGWSTYFSGNTTVDTGERRKTLESRASHASSGSRGSYWPDPSAPVAQLRNAKPGLTDSHGNQLAKLNVRTGSPSIGHTGDATGNGMAIAEGIPAKISHTDSVATSMNSDSNRQQTLDNDKSMANAYPGSQSTGVGDYAWAFDDSSWSGPPRRLNRPPSSTYTNSFVNPNDPTTRSEDLMKSSIRPVTQWPNDSSVFSASPSAQPGNVRSPMATPRPARPSEGVRDYFGSHDHRREHSQNDMSWLNLNGNPTPTARGPGPGSGAGANH